MKHIDRSGTEITEQRWWELRAIPEYVTVREYRAFESALASEDFGEAGEVVYAKITWFGTDEQPYIYESNLKLAKIFEFEQQAINEYEDYLASRGLGQWNHSRATGVDHFHEIGNTIVAKKYDAQYQDQIRENPLFGTW